MTGPYGRTAWTYRRAGWAGVLPILLDGRPHKKLPPGGYTGWAGVDPSGADIQAWTDGPQAVGNIALRLGDGLYGLDVDAYGGKTGAQALAALEAECGPFPPTWITTSRRDGISGIRLFRATLPVGRVWVDEPAGRGAGIEAVHRGHRYAMVWPSVHPDTGDIYGWNASGLPDPRELPELSALQVERLSQPGEVRTGTIAGHDETLRAVSAWRQGDPCPRVVAASGRAMGGLSAAVAGHALHPTANEALFELCCLGNEGHVGVARALAEHYAAFIEVRAGRVVRGGDGPRREAAAEWWRMVRGAVGKLDTLTARDECDCAALAGEGFTVLPGPPEPDASSSHIDQPRFNSSTGALRAALLSPKQLAAREPPAPLVGGLLYRDSLAWLIGKSGSFKSFVALDLAAAVAGEAQWAGRHTAHGPVLYLAAEGGGGMGLRIRAWETLRECEMSERLAVLPRPVQAVSDEWGSLVELAAEDRPTLIVVDTQARVSVGVRENDNTEVGKLIEQLDRLRRASGACVLTVHHIGRNGEDARGASALDGAQDTELRIERVGGPKELKARLKIDKQKDGPDTDVVDFTLSAVNLGTDPASGEPLSSLVATASPFAEAFPVAAWEEDLGTRAAQVMAVLHEHFPADVGATAAQVLSVIKERFPAMAKRYPRATFYRVWKSIVDSDRIEKVPGTQRWVPRAVIDGAGVGGV